MPRAQWVSPTPQGEMLAKALKRIEKLFNKIMDKLENEDKIDTYMVDSISSLLRSMAYAAKTKDELATTRDIEKRLANIEDMLSQTETEESLIATTKHTK